MQEFFLEYEFQILSGSTKSQGSELCWGVHLQGYAEGAQARDALIPMSRLRCTASMRAQLALLAGPCANASELVQVKLGLPGGVYSIRDFLGILCLSKH